METPDTEQGRMTERVMARVREKLPLLVTHDFNRVYESVLEVLNEEGEEAERRFRESIGGGEE